MADKSPKEDFNDSYRLTYPGQKMVNDFNYAARIGDEKGVAAFLELYPRAINEKADNGLTALMVAAANGEKGVVELLLKKGADPDVTTTEGRAALRFAEREGQRYIAALLRQASDEKKRRLAVKPSRKEVDAFCAAARAGDDGKVAEYIESYPYYLDARASSGLTALMYAAANGNMSTVKLLLKNDASVDAAMTEGGRTALHFARREGQRDIAELLEQSAEQQAAERAALADLLKRGGRGKPGSSASPGQKP